jgi:hypothetical protein
LIVKDYVEFLKWDKEKYSHENQGIKFRMVSNCGRKVHATFEGEKCEIIKKDTPLYLRYAKSDQWSIKEKRDCHGSMMVTIVLPQVEK